MKKSELRSMIRESLVAALIESSKAAEDINAKDQRVEDDQKNSTKNNK